MRFIGAKRLCSSCNRHLPTVLHAKPFWEAQYKVMGNIQHLQPAWNLPAVKSLMIQNNLTPKELAAKCQIPIDRVYAFLNAKNQTLGPGRKIAEGLACNVADLLDTPKENAPEPLETL